jgi:hypothetical protein
MRRRQAHLLSAPSRLHALRISKAASDRLRAELGDLLGARDEFDRDVGAAGR